MRNKRFVVGLVAVAIVLAGLAFIIRPFGQKRSPVKKSSITSRTKASLPSKKTISKNMGAMTVKILNSKNQNMSVRVRAFKVMNSESSSYAASFVSNAMQELSPGVYDIEIDTMPQKIYKRIKVSRGRETVKDIGRMIGVLNVKALNSKKKEASYAVRILYPISGNIIATTVTNRPIEIVSGIYDIAVETLPRQLKKDVKVEKGKETVLDLGCITGTLFVKALDEAGKETMYTVRIKKPENAEVVASTSTNRPLELMAGLYDVKVLSNPAQSKNGVNVAAGEETALEFLIKIPPASPKAAAKQR